MLILQIKSRAVFYVALVVRPLNGKKIFEEVMRREINWKEEPNEIECSGKKNSILVPLLSQSSCRVTDR